jgi:hypothetical protein
MIAAMACSWSSVSSGHHAFDMTLFDVSLDPLKFYQYTVAVAAEWYV